MLMQKAPGATRGAKPNSCVARQAVPTVVAVPRKRTHCSYVGVAGLVKARVALSRSGCRMASAAVEGPPEETPVTQPGCLTFKLHYAAGPGEVVKLVGSGAEFGDWSVERGVALTWSEGDIWTAKLALHPMQEHEFKCVVYDTKTKQANWEGGKNRRLDVAASPPELSLEWGSAAATHAPPAEPAEPALSDEELAARAAELAEGSDLIAKAFASMVASAKPGSPWEAAPCPFVYDTPEELAGAAQALGLEEAVEVVST